MNPIRRVLAGLTIAFTAGAVVATAASPAGAQQVVDAGGGNGQGGLAFVLLVVLVAAIWGSLFFMDRIRRRSAEKEEA